MPTTRAAFERSARRLCATTLLVAASALVVGVGPASASPAGRVTPAHARPASLSARAICRRLREHFGPVALGGGRHRLTVLATGDSMIYPISEELALAHFPATRVVVGRHDGTGLTTATVDWHRLAPQQVARFRPGATVISLGGRDGGIPLRNAAGWAIPCCGAEWLSLYAGLLRPLATAYLRAGAGQLYWLLLPAPREAARAPLFEAVNQAILMLAAEMGPAMHVLPVNSVISPGGFQSLITYEGLQIAPRAPDGIHLTHAGACVELSLVEEAMLADGVLERHAG